jgi:hypothetical protein
MVLQLHTWLAVFLLRYTLYTASKKISNFQTTNLNMFTPFFSWTSWISVAIPTYILSHQPIMQLKVRRLRVCCSMRDASRPMKRLENA